MAFIDNLTICSRQVYINILYTRHGRNGFFQSLFCNPENAFLLCLSVLFHALHDRLLPPFLLHFICVWPWLEVNQNHFHTSLFPRRHDIIILALSMPSISTPANACSYSVWNGYGSRPLTESLWTGVQSCSVNWLPNGFAIPPMNELPINITQAGMMTAQLTHA